MWHIALALAVLLLAPAGLFGQHRFPNTIEFWGGAAGWSGENAEGFETGGGTGSTFLFDVGWPVQVGGDLGFVRFKTDQVVGKVDEFSGSAAIRYRITASRSLIPFLGARAGYTRLSADLENFRFEQNGALVGGSGGLEIPLRGRAMLVGTLEALYYHYGDTEIFLEDVSIPSTGGGAWRYWGRLGISFRWGR